MSSASARADVSPRGLVAWGLGLVSLGVAARVLLLAELSTLPDWTHARSDEAYYLAAARAWAAGEGCEPFHMSPLYVVLLATLEGTVGLSPLSWRIAQAVLGLGSALVLAAYARRVWDRRTALWALGLSLICGPLLFYESVLAVATLASTLMIVALYCAERGRGPGLASEPWWAAAGMVFGLAMLARPNAALLVLAAMLCPWMSPAPLAFRLRRSLTVAALAFAVTLPVTWHNTRCSGEIVWITDTGGLNVYIGNHRGANGLFNVPPRVPEATDLESQARAFTAVAEREAGRTLTRGEVARHWTRATLDEIRADPLAWLRLLARKLVLVFQGEDFSNSRSYAFRDELMHGMGPWLVQWSYLVPLAWLGLGVWLRAPRRHWLHLSFTLAYIVALVAVFVLGHYRQVLVPLFVLAAVEGGKALAGSVRTGARTRLLRQLLVVLAGAVCSQWPVYETSWADEAFKHAYALHVQGNTHAAESWYRRALTEAPDHRAARRNLAILYTNTGRTGDAVPLWRELLAEARARGDAQATAEAEFFLSRADR